MSHLQVQLQHHGSESRDLWVKLEVFDERLDRVAEQWTSVDGGANFELADAVYGVRATLPSGASVQRGIAVAGGGFLQLDLSTLSPHESHEWAYLGSAGGPRAAATLDQAAFGATWARLWRREPGAAWEVVPLDPGGSSSWDADGVHYEMDVPAGALHFLQVGGPDVPWRCVALPASHALRVLIRPAAVPEEDAGTRQHPLEVVVASANSDVEALTTMLARGELGMAEELMESARVAEQLLYGKVGDPAAAAVGGYYLLRTGALDRLHDWTNNLANWIDWLPDGAVIHAWHVAAAKGDAGLDEVRARLLEAEERGVPVYAEGLRLLALGLRQLHERAPADDEVASALARVEPYRAAAEVGVPTTTFDGSRPDDPLVRAPTGVPEDRRHLAFVYDVPLAELVRAGLVSTGTPLRWDALGPGKSLPLVDAARFVGADDRWRWKLESSDVSLEELTARLRRGEAPDPGAGSPTAASDASPQGPTGPTGPTILGLATAPAPRIPDVRSWSSDRIRTRLEEVKEKSLDWSGTTGTARKWWENFEREYVTQPAVVLRVAEELAARKASITEFFQACQNSRIEDVQTNLRFLDYVRHERDRPGLDESGA